MENGPRTAHLEKFHTGTCPICHSNVQQQPASHLLRQNEEAARPLSFRWSLQLRKYMSTNERRRCHLISRENSDTHSSLHG